MTSGTDGSSAPGAVTAHTAAALIIGGELLSGKIRDENFYQLSQMLRAKGIELKRVIVCPDHLATIEQDVRQLSAQFDVLFTSGGVGPTHDDLTMQGVSNALGVPTIVDQDLLAHIENLYQNETGEAHRLMARVPQGARLIPSGGWPVIVVNNIWILPGVPELFRSKLATIREYLSGPHPFFSERVYCSREELLIKDTIDLVVQEFPEVEVGSYPKWFDSRYKTLVTFDARDELAVQRAAARLKELLAGTVVDM